MPEFLLRAYKLEGYVDDGINTPYWTELTSYVTTPFNAPWFTRNNDGKPTSEGFKLSLVDTINITVLQKLKYVKYYIDNTARFIGIVAKSSPIVTNRTWEYDIYNGFYDLTKYKVESSEIHALLTGTADPYKYKAVDNTTFHNCSIPWLLEVLLAHKGFSVDATALYLENASTLVLSRTYDYYLRDIRLDVNMLYALNQDNALRYAIIDADMTDGYQFSKNKITAFDLFTLLCSVFSITVRWNGSSYLLERRANTQTSSEKYTIAQSNIWEYAENNIEGKLNVKNFMMRASARLNYYAFSAITPLQQWGTSIKGTGSTIAWYDSLIFLKQDKTKAAGETMDMSDISGFLQLRDMDNALYFRDGDDNETEYSFECSLQDTFYNVKEHFFDSRRERSIIKQGVFS